jgi:CheY-like chemotaxis protein
MIRSCVLHVDDDSNDQLLLAHASRKASLGIPLLGVESGEKAIAYLSGEDQYSNRAEFPLPCILLLDIKMKGLNGFDVLKWIRGQAELQELIVIMYSGSRHESDLREAAKLGANSFVTKPNDSRLLSQFVRALEEYWLKFHEFGWESQCRPKDSPEAVN